MQGRGCEMSFLGKQWEQTFGRSLCLLLCVQLLKTEQLWHFSSMSQTSGCSALLVKSVYSWLCCKQRAVSLNTGVIRWSMENNCEAVLQKGTHDGGFSDERWGLGLREGGWKDIMLIEGSGSAGDVLDSEAEGRVETSGLERNYL